MTRMRLSAVLTVLALITGLAGFWALSKNRPPPPATAAGPLPLEFAATDLVTIRRTTLTESVAITGTLKPVDATLVRSKVPGVLTALHVREGMVVQRAQTLAEIDASEFVSRLAERNASLQSAQAQLEQAQRVLANTQRLFERQFVAQSALDQAQANVAIAQGQRDAAAAQRELAQTALRDTRILAPLAGVVAERFVQAGEKLASDARVLSLVKLDPLELEALVPAQVASRVTLGTTVTLNIEGLPAPQSGQVLRIGPSTQAGTRSVPLYIGVRNTQPLIRAGVFARGRLTLAQRPDVLAIPLAAVQEAGGQARVYLIADTQLQQRTVTLGLREEGQGADSLVEVIEGLNEGDVLIGKPLGTLPLDRPVLIHPAPGP